MEKSGFMSSATYTDSGASRLPVAFLRQLAMERELRRAARSRDLQSSGVDDAAGSDADLAARLASLAVGDHGRSNRRVYGAVRPSSVTMLAEGGDSSGGSEQVSSPSSARDATPGLVATARTARGHRQGSPPLPSFGAPTPVRASGIAQPAAAVAAVPGRRLGSVLAPASVDDKERPKSRRVASLRARSSPPASPREQERASASSGSDARLSELMRASKQAQELRTQRIHLAMQVAHMLRALQHVCARYHSARPGLADGPRHAAVRSAVGAAAAAGRDQDCAEMCHMLEVVDKNMRLLRKNVEHAESSMRTPRERHAAANEIRAARDLLDTLPYQMIPVHVMGPPSESAGERVASADIAEPKTRKRHR